MKELFVLTFHYEDTRLHLAMWDHSHVVGVFDSEDALSAAKLALLPQYEAEYGRYGASWAWETTSTLLNNPTPVI
tara:strand:- start:211 stop:435 length:225 start_codon:yes stop_codon:yes gene_type:complete